MVALSKWDFLPPLPFGSTFVKIRLLFRCAGQLSLVSASCLEDFEHLCFTLRALRSPGRRFAAPLRRRVILWFLPSPPVQGSSVLLARSRTFSHRTTALGRLVQKRSRSGAAFAAGGKAPETSSRFSVERWLGLHLGL